MCNHETRDRDCADCFEKYVGKFKVGDIVDWHNTRYPDQTVAGCLVKAVHLGCEYVSEKTTYLITRVSGTVSADSLVLSNNRIVESDKSLNVS